MSVDPLVPILLYFVLPLWLLAGFADWACHRASGIERTSGAKESMIHLLMFAEVGIPLLAAIFLKINALVIALMIIGLVTHQATAFWDTRYAASRRHISPFEQHVHSFLELIPLTAFLCVVALHWGQFTALFGLGSQTPDFALTWKPDPLPVVYVVTLMALILVFEILPFLEELYRGLRAARGKLVPDSSSEVEPPADRRLDL